MNVEIGRNTKQTVRGIVTCDLEGRIETFDQGAQTLFGYAPEELIGRKRVSIFSPGMIVLGHVGRWLKRARSEPYRITSTVTGLSRGFAPLRRNRCRLNTRPRRGQRISSNS